MTVTLHHLGWVIVFSRFFFAEVQCQFQIKGFISDNGAVCLDAQRRIPEEKTMIKRLGDLAQFSHDTLFFKGFNHQNRIACF